MARAPAPGKFAAFAERAASQPAFISGAVVLFSLFCASIFLFAYLRVFDWRLIWLVDYADILKVGLVAIAFFSGIAWYLWAVFDDAYGWAKPGKGAGWRRYVIRAFWIGSMAYWAYVEYVSGQPRYALLASVFLSIVAVFLVARWTVRMSEPSRGPNVKDAVFLAFLLVVTVSLFGTARDAWRSIVQNAVIDGETLPGGRLIMLTSRHAVFYRDGITITVPASAVKRLESQKQ